MQKETCLFLDTQVFDGNQYDFENKLLRKLCEIGRGGWVRLLMPDITRREVERHIAAKAKESFTSLEHIRNKGFHRNLRRPPFDVLAKGFSEDAIREELLEQFRDFCRQTNVLELPSVDLDAAAVLDDYFAGNPPFGEGKKKHEFPDAFAAQVLGNWSKKTSRAIVVVSRDGDWAKIRSAKIDVLKHVGEFLERLIPVVDATKIRNAVKHSGDAHEAIKKKFEAEEFDASEYAATISDLVVRDVDLEEVYVTEAKDGKAEVAATVIIDFTATVQGRRRVKNPLGTYGPDEPYKLRIADSITSRFAAGIV